MWRSSICLLVAAGLSSATPGTAQQSTARTTSAAPASASAGQQLYAVYCAVCHGVNGKGDGPAASALKTAPPDLTALARSNSGKFPQGHVENVLEFGVKTPAHGSKEMPTWGPALQSVSTSSAGNHQTAHQQIEKLIVYLRSIQQ
jgi:mono/diheme cytochrome c family protein